MKTICILRHARAENSAAGGDAARSLTESGKQAARAVGQYLRREALAPDVVLCSSARRAVQTWSLVAESLAGKPEVLIDEAFYRAGPEGFLDRIAGLNASTSGVLIVAHNPTLHQLAFSLTRSADGDALDRLAQDFPPGALAVLTFDGDDWSGIGVRSCRLTGLVTPSMLG
jgi:phosphohistidine phosphatase